MKTRTAWCSARVWDNGDMMDCGKEILRADRCIDCLHLEVATLRLEIRQHQADIERAQRRLAELQTESG